MPVLDCTTTTPEKPAFLTQNTYFWSPGSSARSRRLNEERRHAEVADWLESLGFTVSQCGDTTTAHRDDITVSILYRESCNHVYRRTTTTRNGRRSNLSIVH